jgi:hypothetical protein
VLENTGVSQPRTTVVQAGELSILNDQWFEVRERATLQMRQIQLQLPPGGGGKMPKNDHIVVNKGLVETFDGLGAEVKSIHVKSGGEAFIGGDLKVTGKVAGFDYGIYADEGMMTLRTGHTATVTHGVYLKKATVATAAHRTDATKTIAKIDGTIFVTETTFRLTTAEEERFATLLITGNATLNDGLFEATVSAQTGAKRDVIQTDKKFITSAEFKIKVTEKDKLNGQGAGEGTTWYVLVSAEGFEKDDAPSLPVVTQGGSRVLSNDKKQLGVRK